MPNFFQADLEQVGDVLLGATTITDDSSGLGLVGAVAGDLARGARFEVADLLAQHSDVVIACGFTRGDRRPTGEVALDRFMDGALALARQFPALFAAGA
ncbi:hypothetical protein ACWEQA_12735 [Nocardia sp. NPDC004085]